MELEKLVGVRAPAVIALVGSWLAACGSGVAVPAPGADAGSTSGTATDFFTARKQNHCAALTPYWRAGGVHHDPSSCETWYSGSDVSTECIY